MISEIELSKRAYNTPGLPRFYLKFYNIGNKGAKSFEASWSFDIDAFIELIRRNNEDEIFRILRRENFISISSENTTLIL
ncbi:MAG: hypothetical protein U5K72_09845 [Balneolaceae bacterium]|nr:hypothetical protein [Balneolaceae bacterium]